MKRFQRRALEVESVETRVLLSGVGAAHGGVSAEVGTVLPGAVVRLNGTILGTEHTARNVADAGNVTTLHGQGLLQGVGLVSAKGTLHATGFIDTGRSSGLLVLSGRHGALRLELTGPPQGGFSELPAHYAYTITGGTRQYAGATGAGTIDFSQLKLFGQATGFQIKFHAATA